MQEMWDRFPLYAQYILSLSRPRHKFKFSVNSEMLDIALFTSLFKCSRREHGGAQWSTVEDSGAQWNTVEHCGAQWSTVEHSGVQSSYLISFNCKHLLLKGLYLEAFHVKIN